MSVMNERNDDSDDDVDIEAEFSLVSSSTCDLSQLTSDFCQLNLLVVRHKMSNWQRRMEKKKVIDFDNCKSRWQMQVLNKY